MKTIIEPFRSKMVEPIKFTTRSQRMQILADAGYNLFQVKAEDVIIDLLTDSGTAAMSSEQWAAMMRGDESYAGCASYYRFRDKVADIFGFSQVIPVHQGRAAERLFFGCFVKPGDIVPSNTHFDTTRANIEARGAQAVDLPCVEVQSPDSDHPFKGNIDIQALQELIKAEGAHRIPFAMLTITNNAGGGQPVSLSNIAEYRRVLRTHNIPLYVDAARFAENAYFIQRREAGQMTKSIRSIAREVFSHADGCLMSAKKDGMANMGGFIALNDEQLAAKIKESLILTEGFPTYGGLSGRDLEAIAVGLEEVLSEDYLQYREAAARYLYNGLTENGVPCISPPAMHAVYINAQAFLRHIPQSQLPGQVVACQLYLEGGIRACEIGTVMFGQHDPDTGAESVARQELVRLAIPRRVYTQSHFDYVIEVAGILAQGKEELSGMRIVYQPPALRHFTATFAPLTTTKGCNPAPRRPASAAV